MQIIIQLRITGVAKSQYLSGVTLWKSLKYSSHSGAVFTFTLLVQINGDYQGTIFKMEYAIYGIWVEVHNSIGEQLVTPNSGHRTSHIVISFPYRNTQIYCLEQIFTKIVPLLLTPHPVQSIPRKESRVIDGVGYRITLLHHWRMESQSEEFGFRCLVFPPRTAAFRAKNEEIPAVLINNIIPDLINNFHQSYKPHILLNPAMFRH